MNIKFRKLLLTSATSALLILITAVTCLNKVSASDGICGNASIHLPFTDAAGSAFFCAIAEAYFTGITNGTSPTTFSPSTAVSREQMSAFVTRTLDKSLTRSSERAALNHFSTPYFLADGLIVNTGPNPQSVLSDGADLWVANSANAMVERISATDGQVSALYGGATNAQGVLLAKGLVFVTGNQIPGVLYTVDPTELLGGQATKVSNTLGNYPNGIAFDGGRVWTANAGFPGQGSVSVISWDSFGNAQVSTVTAGFSHLYGMLFDGANIWVTDTGDSTLKKLSPFDASVEQTISVGLQPRNPVFDGTNIWVPNQNSNSVTVVRASTGAVLATLVDPGMNNPQTAAFDGERILVTHQDGVMIWKASDLTPLGNHTLGPYQDAADVYGACSDGRDFWVTRRTANQLIRF